MNMKKRNYLYAALCGLTLTTGFTACEDDDTPWDPMQQGSKIEMASTRGFILNEGSYGLNNATITYFDYLTDNPYAHDLYQTQNEKNIGDTGQDLIEEDGYFYLSVYGSNYVAKLNGVGIETGRLSLSDRSDLGQPRYMAADNGFLYVTTYGGYVVKVNTMDMSIVGQVKVGDNPEQIVEENGYIYCVNSGWGKDNRLSVIRERDFQLDRHVTIFDNPQAIVETDGYLAIQGYGGEYPDYTYPVAVFNPATDTYKEIGKGTNIAAENGTLYVVNCQTDYSSYPYTNTTEFYTYDFRTGNINRDFLKNAPAELASASVYGLSVNGETGHIYVLTTSFVSGDGAVYHFDRQGNYVGSFSSYGQCPRKIVFED